MGVSSVASSSQTTELYVLNLLSNVFIIMNAATILVIFAIFGAIAQAQGCKFPNVVLNYAELLTFYVCYSTLQNQCWDQWRIQPNYWIHECDSEGPWKDQQYLNGNFSLPSCSLHEIWVCSPIKHSCPTNKRSTLPMDLPKWKLRIHYSDQRHGYSPLSSGTLQISVHQDFLCLWCGFFRSSQNNVSVLRSDDDWIV